MAEVCIDRSGVAGDKSGQKNEKVLPAIKRSKKRKLGKSILCENIIKDGV